MYLDRLFCPTVDRLFCPTVKQLMLMTPVMLLIRQTDGLCVCTLALGWSSPAARAAHWECRPSPRLRSVSGDVSLLAVRGEYCTSHQVHRHDRSKA